MSWSIYCASVQGRSHQENNQPCQDAWSVEHTANGLAACVCDGAGSARYSDVGSRYVSRLFVQRVSEFGDVDYLTIEEIQPVIIRTLSAIREQLVSLANDKQGELKDFACTLVAAWIGKRQGFLFHLGDGAAIASYQQDGQRIDTVSVPENGEYANQTWFLTSTDWQEHLRITPITAKIERVILMSDGVQPFAMNKHCDALYLPFIEPVTRFLQQNDEQTGSEALKGTLDDPRTYSITGDDKTLLVAFREM